MNGSNQLLKNYFSHFMKLKINYDSQLNSTIEFTETFTLMLSTLVNPTLAIPDRESSEYLYD